jgi:glycosyltransferase involved in cell wall biosynthesis
MKASKGQAWKVDLVWERDWFLGLVSGALEKLGYLGTVYGGFPRYRYLRLSIPAEKIKTRPAAALWNYGIDRLRLPRAFRMDEPRRIGLWVARQAKLAPVVLVNGTAYRFLFPKLLERPILRLVERGSMFPEDFFRLPQKARKEAGYPYQKDLPAEIIDEIAKAQLAQKTICGSERVRQSYLQRGFAPGKFHTIHYGVDPGRFPRAVHEDPRGRNLRIGWLGVVGFRKGIDRVRRISEWAAEKSLPVEFHFVGPVQDIESLEILRRFRRPYVLHGVKKGEELEALVTRWDLYLLPSYEEGFPVSVLEAMSAGIPAVVSADTGAVEAIDGEDVGVVLKFSDPEELNGGFLRLCQDSSHRREAGARARQRIQTNFSLEVYRSKIADLHSSFQMAWAGAVESG